MNGNLVHYTEYFWELMGTRVNEESPTTDDQANINLALDRIQTRLVYSYVMVVWCVNHDITL